VESARSRTIALRTDINFLPGSESIRGAGPPLVSRLAQVNPVALNPNHGNK
jgi:hypothetical protein